MKRIFSILLLFGMVLCLSVTTLASTDNLVEKRFVTSVSDLPILGTNWSVFDNAEGYIITNEGERKYFDRLSFANTSQSGKALYVEDGENTICVYATVGGVYVSAIALDEDAITNSSFLNWYRANTQINMCDGTSCPATDVNEDNRCDDCGLPLTLSLRNDTYSYNGYPMPRIIEVESGSMYDLFDYWGHIYGPYNLVIVSRTGNFDSALMYQVAPNVEIVNGNAVTSDDTEVILFKPAYSDGGTPYWKYTATDTWSTGSLLAPKDQILWSGDSISADSSIDIIEGDPNFMDPLWVTVEKVTQGEIPKMTESLVGSVTLLTACGIGLLALLVVLAILRRKSVLFLR